MIRTKLRALAATAAVAGIVATAGIAYAAFARQDTGQATGASEKFNALTVVGQWDGGSLLPGESGAVKLTINAPSNNTVNAKVTQIKPAQINAGDITGDVASNDKAACANALSAATYTPTGDTVVLQKNATNVVLTLDKAVTLSASATELCQSMTFKTSWTVYFEASRATATLGTAGIATLTS